MNSVAQAMRENAAPRQKLIADKTSRPTQKMIALDDLKAHEKFARAHVDGLKNLISSFETLYNSMPGPQRNVATRRSGALVATALIRIASRANDRVPRRDTVLGKGGRHDLHHPRKVKT